MPMLDDLWSIYRELGSPTPQYLSPNSSYYLNAIVLLGNTADPAYHRLLRLFMIWNKICSGTTNLAACLCQLNIKFAM